MGVQKKVTFDTLASVSLTLIGQDTTIVVVILFWGIFFGSIVAIFLILWMLYISNFILPRHCNIIHV